MKPQDRSTFYDQEVSVEGPHDGYLTVMQLVEALESHRKNADVWTAEKLSAVYKIKDSEAKNLTQHYGNFYLIQKRNDPKMEFHDLVK